MARTVRDVMTANPATVDSRQPLEAVARLMRDADTGAIVVTDNGGVAGIVTDRDIVVRGLADGKAAGTAVREVCSADVETVAPDYSIDQAVHVMRDRAIRRLPVVENGDVVGIVSIGDLAMERDSGSALADISAAPGNS